MWSRTAPRRTGHLTESTATERITSKHPTLGVLCLYVTIPRAVYIDTAAGMIESTIAGFNATIFAYGQTSSGK